MADQDRESPGSMPSKSPDAGQAKPRNKAGWDGKLRVDKEMEPLDQNEKGETSPGTSDDEEPEDGHSPAPIPHRVEALDLQPADGEVQGTARINQIIEVPGGEIVADEDLLENVPHDETDIDLNHSRIEAILSLRLERFGKLTRLCLRQNQISHIKFPTQWPSTETIQELDLYDNLISHIRNLDDFTCLIILDLSFNKIKHVKHISHMKKLKELYFVQNRIDKIAGLEGLVELTGLELGGNRIREIENLDTLINLKELWLGKNKIEVLQNLDKLQNLTLLSIQSNRLTSPSLSHLSTLGNLTDLYISHNAIDSLKPLSACVHLTTIDVSSNPIESLEGLEDMHSLEELWASNCKLFSFEQIGKVLEDKKSLETVYFEGNPIQTMNKVLYRNKVKLALPRIKQIDATFVRVV